MVMEKKMKIWITISYVLFAIISMTGMLYYSATKEIVIVDVAQDQLAWDSSVQYETAQKMESESVETEKLLHFQEGNENTNYLCIPLAQNIMSEQVHIENYYMEKEMRVYIEGVEEQFYETEAISGNIQNILKGTYDTVKGSVLLTFQLADVFEYRSVLEENCLYIELVIPKEMYEKIVVVDVGHGGEDQGFVTEEITEKDLTLDIAKKLKEKLDNTDVKVYYTRMEDKNVPDEDRVAIANRVKADMLISIHGAWMDDSKIYGTQTIYNEAFFIPGFGSVELADLLEREVVTSISGKGLGLVAAEDDNIVIRNATVPAAMIQVGCLSNAQEIVLFQKDSYIDRIATGIYDAIMKAYDGRESTLWNGVNDESR